jgi:hypothetical protein
MAALFSAFDRPSYQRLLPNHIADIESYPEEVIKAMVAGAFTVKLSNNIGHAIALDEAHEMCVNRDIKMEVIRPTQTYLRKTLHFFSYRIKAHKNLIAELFPPSTQLTHDANALTDNQSINKKWEDNISAMRSLIKTHNLFVISTSSTRGLVNVFNGKEATNEQTHDLINAHEIGHQKYVNYVTHYL